MKKGNFRALFSLIHLVFLISDPRSVGTLRCRDTPLSGVSKRFLEVYVHCNAPNLLRRKKWKKFFERLSGFCCCPAVAAQCMQRQ